MEPLAEYVDGLPNLCGQEPLISEAITAGRKYPVFPHDADIESAASTFAVALHMHQPLIVNIQVPGLGVAESNRGLRSSVGRGVAVDGERSFRDDFGL